MMECKHDQRANKIDLLAGAYRDENGNPYPLPTVIKAFKEIIQEKDVSIFQSAPIQGDREFAELLLNLCFGPTNKKLHQTLQDKTIALMHCQGAAHGLFLILNVLRRFWQSVRTDVTEIEDGQQLKNTVWISSDTWPEHILYLDSHQIRYRPFRYYDLQTHHLDYDGILEDLAMLQENDFVLLQPCAHNPTGVDPSKEQWLGIANLIVERKARVIFDFAYMGLANGSFEEDAYIVRAFLDMNIEFFLTLSCSKNFGLYSGRVGIAAGLMQSSEKARLIHENFILNSRLLYKAPNNFGSTIVKRILSSQDLREAWTNDVKHMADRLMKMRSRLLEELEKLESKRDWSAILLKHKGMFSFTGLGKKEADKLVTDYAIHILENGRISVSGITEHNVAAVARGLFDVTECTI